MRKTMSLQEMINLQREYNELRWKQEMEKLSLSFDKTLSGNKEKIKGESKVNKPH